MKINIQHIGSIILLLICNFSSLALGSLCTTEGIRSQWYKLLEKAHWTPTGWAFGFAWMSLWFAFAFYISFLWFKTDQKRSVIIHYILAVDPKNVSWNPAFFKHQNTLAGLFIIVGSTFLELFYFFKLLGAKSFFILPYFLWLLVTMSLNGYICLNN